MLPAFRINRAPLLRGCLRHRRERLGSYFGNLANKVRIARLDSFVNLLKLSRAGLEISQLLGDRLASANFLEPPLSTIQIEVFELFVKGLLPKKDALRLFVSRGISRL